MPTQIQRSPNLGGYPVFFASTVDESTTISVGVSSSVAVVVEQTPNALARIDWYAAQSQDGPWVPIYLSGEEQAYTNIPSNGVYVTPPELFACHWLKGVVNNAAYEFTGAVIVKG